MVDRIGPDSNRDPRNELVSKSFVDFSQENISTRKLGERVGEYLHYKKAEDGSDREEYLKVVKNESSSNNAVVLEYSVGAKSIAPEEKENKWHITCDDSIADRVPGHFYKALFLSVKNVIDKTNGIYPNTGWNIHLTEDRNLRTSPEKAVWFERDEVRGKCYQFSHESIHLAPNNVFLNEFDKEDSEFTKRQWEDIEKILYRKFFNGRMYKNPSDKVKAHFKLVYYSGNHNYSPKYVEDRANEFYKDIEHRVDCYFTKPGTLRDNDRGVVNRLVKGTFGLIPEGLTEEELKRAKEMALEARNNGQKLEPFDGLLESEIQPEDTEETKEDEKSVGIPKKESKLAKGALNALKVAGIGTAAVAGAVAVVATPIGLALITGGAAKVIYDKINNKDSSSQEESKSSNESGNSSYDRGYSSFRTTSNNSSETREGDILDRIFTDQAIVDGSGGGVHSATGGLNAIVDNDGCFVDANTGNVIFKRDADGYMYDPSGRYVGQVDDEGYVFDKDNNPKGQLRDGYFIKL